MIRASNQAGLVEFERDGNGRIISESVNGRKVESKLDTRGHRIERRIGRGEVGEGLVRYAHDALGLVASIAIDDHAPLVFTRDVLGRETRRASSEGYRLDQTWDAVGQVMTQSAGRGASGLAGLTAVRAPPASGTAAERHYAWDNAGAPVGIDDLIWGETRYAYDANGQVAEASFGDGFTEKFHYDAAKNVAGVKLAGPEIGPGLGGLLSWQSTPGGVVQLARGPNGETIALTHDVCGRVVTRRVDRRGFRPKIWRYGWDALDRLVSCETPDGDIWFYRYDPFGRRLTKVRKLREAELAWTAQKFGSLVPTDERKKTKIWIWPEPPNAGQASDGCPPVVGTHFTWDGDTIAEEASLRLDGSIDPESGTCWHFEPNGFRPLAQQKLDGPLLHIVNDHLGTPCEMFEEDGRLCWAANHTTWGVVRKKSVFLQHANDDGRAVYRRDDSGSANGAAGANYSCPMAFPGQWKDEESDLNYNFMRHYDPLAQQYASADPCGLYGGSRPHGYVECPNIWIDPLGLKAASKNWSTARADYWERVANQEQANPTGKYSKYNLEQMREGKAPQMKVVVRYKDGRVVTKNVKMELHHRQIPQRNGPSSAANEPWNLTPANPWAHAAMDPYRFPGGTLDRVIQGTNSFTP